MNPDGRKKLRWIQKTNTDYTSSEISLRCFVTLRKQRKKDARGRGTWQRWIAEGGDSDNSTNYRLLILRMLDFVHYIEIKWSKAQRERDRETERACNEWPKPSHKSRMRGRKPGHLKYILVVVARRHLQSFPSTIVEGPGAAHSETKRSSCCQNIIDSRPCARVRSIHHEPVRVPSVDIERLTVQRELVANSDHERQEGNRLLHR